MFHGITITLYSRAQSGTDDFNRPVYTETETEVSNVLVGEPSTDDIVNELNLSGKKLAYTLAIPKGDTNEWENCRVKLPKPWNATFRVIGKPTEGIESNIPLKWNRKVKLEYEQSES